MTWSLMATRASLLVVSAVLVVTLAARGLRPVPDLVAVVVVVIALRDGPRVGAGVGLAAGWILDLLPPGSSLLGWSALAYAVAGHVVGRAAQRGPLPWPLIALQVLLATVIVDAFSVVSALLRNGHVDLAGLGWRWVVTATLGLILGPLLVRLDAFVDGATGRLAFSGVRP